jgi:hypothetical protein
MLPNEENFRFVDVVRFEPLNTEADLETAIQSTLPI